MSREIKFRAWHKKYKRMYKVMSLNMCENEGLWAYVWGRDPIESKDFLFAIQPNEIVVLQYTEMTDKNGKEIYEGDILKVPDLYETPENTSPTFHNEEVKYILGCFYSGGDPMVEYWDYLSDESEVIGNIYENPELMEQSK